MKNKGFSLIELIVVVAIMGVAMAIGGYALSAITLANAKSCATEINAGLERTRTQAYSKEAAATVTFYRDGSNNLMMKKSYETEAKKIGGPTVKVSYRVKGGAYKELKKPETIDGVVVSDEIVFSFNRSTGAFVSTYDSILVSGAGKTYTITCYLLTGKTKLE